MKKLSLLSSLLILLSMFSLSALAQTPDEMTPAEETVCSEEEGALKGLCNAFCEAMDCHLNEGIHASPKACGKVLANYHKKSGDIDPPCLDSGCSATSTAAANEFYALCITNASNCNELKCAHGARKTYIRLYQGCVRDCSTSCSLDYNACTITAKVAYKACLVDAGNDTDAQLLCKSTHGNAISQCRDENTTCTTECSGATGNYEPPSDSCPI